MIKKLVAGVFLVVVAIGSIFAFVFGSLFGLVQSVWHICHPSSRRPKEVSLEPVVIVPEGFQDLSPLIQRLGIGDDVQRQLVESQLSETEKANIRRIMKSKGNDLERWIDSTMRNGQIAEAAIPYASLLEATSEMGLWSNQDT